MDKSRNWCVTIFPHMYDIEPQEMMQQYISENKLRFGAMGEEVCPSTGILHYQSYLCFEGQVRLKTVTSLFPACHAEIMRGTLQQNENYCSKEGSLHKFGVEPHQGQRSDLLGVKRKVDEGLTYKELVVDDANFETIAKYPRFVKEYCSIVRENRLRSDRDMPKVYIRVGEAGEGKTRWLDEQFGLDGWRHAPDPRGQWFDHCDERDTILFDDVESGQIPPFALWKRLCDRYPIQVPVKGGFILWKPKNIVFTSNQHPKKWWGELDEMNWSAYCRRVFKLTTHFAGQVTHYRYNGIQEEEIDTQVRQNASNEEVQDCVESTDQTCVETAIIASDGSQTE